jgi:hypothetical protein
MARGGGMDMGAILKFGAIGVGGYFLYDWWQKRTPGTTVTTGGTGTPVVASAIDGIAAKIMAAAGSGATFTADQWNVYLQQQLVAGKVAPDPATFIGATPRETPLTFAQYWGAVAPKLRSDLGMTGLGMFYGLGQVRRAR